MFEDVVSSAPLDVFDGRQTAQCLGDHHERNIFLGLLQDLQGIHCSPGTQIVGGKDNVVVGLRQLLLEGRERVQNLKTQGITHPLQERHHQFHVLTVVLENQRPQRPRGGKRFVGLGFFVVPSPYLGRKALTGGGSFTTSQ
ncbi:MAG: hypothetical protein ABSC02_16065 [Acidobacteriota bacterium]